MDCIRNDLFLDGYQDSLEREVFCPFFQLKKVMPWTEREIDRWTIKGEIGCPFVLLCTFLLINYCFGINDLICDIMFQKYNITV